jgi:hypothetical protein
MGNASHTNHRMIAMMASYALYRDLLGQHCRAAGVEVWA